ncbi:Uncharacterised protein [Vibrio metschnikovii]|nr:hypothetical protein [Vibrio metschnikovii]EEX36427.1 hypothetical protein VIB_002742 [Vibrio metschnikovii CIP 69.14]SUP49317.1 Uncharacterised protein [Vibrio metschnikovii]SUQ10327.1 Uncharacterised protein [Vibrio metschnikovii]
MDFTLIWSVHFMEEQRLINISALQHFAFCQRQCALIHLEQV